MTTSTVEIQALRERISALSAASLRVGSSLDLETVLREIAESARVLTAARYSVITTIGEEGELADVVLSGFTPEEERLLEAWDDSMKVFDALRDLPSRRYGWPTCPPMSARSASPPTG